MTENIINEREIKVGTMRRVNRILYASLGGAIIAISAILLLAVISAGLKDIQVLGIAIATGIVGLYLIYGIAYSKRWDINVKQWWHNRPS